MGTNYISPIWRMPQNVNKNNLSNYSIYFDGSGNEIDCGTGSSVDITGPISISVWFNTNIVDNARGIVCKNDAAASQVFAQYFFDLLAGEIRWRAGQATVTSPINPDQWYHAVGVYDGSDTTLYIDGAEVATTAAAANSYSSAQPMYIGRRLNQAYFQGEITQVCIFDYALSLSQITYLYALNDPMNISGTQPVAYWPLGDNSNPNDVATFPNTVFSSYSNYSFNFDSVAMFSVADNSVFSFGNGVDDEPFSISTWIKTTIGTNQGVISKYGSGALSEWILYIIGPNKIRLGLWDGSNTVYQLRTSTTSVNTGDWVHIVTTYDGRGGDGSAANTANQGIKIYIDGVEEVAYTDNFQNGYVAMEDTSYNVQIGAYAAAAKFTGSISNTALFDKELTGSEILDIYNSGTPNNLQEPSTYKSNIIAWWPMDENSSYFNGTTWVCRDRESSREAVGSNTSNPADMQGNTPGSTSNGLGSNIDIVDLKGNMKNIDKNSHSINMADYGTPNSQGVTPASSGRTTSVPFP